MTSHQLMTSFSHNSHFFLSFAASATGVVLKLVIWPCYLSFGPSVRTRPTGTYQKDVVTSASNKVSISLTHQACNKGLQLMLAAFPKKIFHSLWVYLLLDEWEHVDPKYWERTFLMENASFTSFSNFPTKLFDGKTAVSFLTKCLTTQHVMTLMFKVWKTSQILLLYVILTWGVYTPLLETSGHQSFLWIFEI